MSDSDIRKAYAAYDSDPRVGGPDDRDAFIDAVSPLMPDRAVVAISEDRQWLVVHHLGTGRWIVYDICHWGYQEYTTADDTGQDAHEVLREFLEGR